MTLILSAVIRIYGACVCHLSAYIADDFILIR